jgi:UPF0271 protein
MEKLYIFDTSAFIMGLHPSTLDQKTLTTPEVVSELGGERFNEKYSATLYTRKLEVTSPAENYLILVEEASSASGDRMKLSKADTSILALALELRAHGSKPTIVSDDFAVQNVAEQLDLNYIHLSSFSIKTHIKWIWYCPGCRRPLPKGFRGELCPTCGTKVKRKALRKSALKQKR